MTEQNNEQLIKEVEADFLSFQRNRRILERTWQLSLEFIAGKQYCDINSSGEIFEEEKPYYWQQRRVYNHIAPIVDTRTAKLARIRPALSVRAASDEESDRHSAVLASQILSSISDKLDLDGILSQAALWSESCGTSFYKVMWNFDSGKVIGVDANGESVCEGEVEVVAVSPFEIYPHSLNVDKLENQKSIIHAKAVSVQDIFERYGVKLVGRDLSQMELKIGSTNHMSGSTGNFEGYEIVIERYEKPTKERPDGRLVVVAGGELLYDGELPYLNGNSGERGYPFVKQTSVPVAGSFFGDSVVKRIIPVQRAFNAVKNRKHEFLNRISMGTVAVEDGSVDMDEFEEDGLMPGKIIVYRQGGTPPEMLTLGTVPDEFWREEESLLQEFVKISGTNDLSENADNYAGITSATGLQLVLEQDESRLAVAYNSLKRALKEIGRHILRLYRQFAGDSRLLKVAQDNSLTFMYFKGSDISSDDVVLEADSDFNLSPGQKRTAIFELLDRGLFNDDSGKLSLSVKNKVLDMLGYPISTGDRDLVELNRARASKENIQMQKSDMPVNTYDDHRLHIVEHTAFLLSETLSKEVETRIVNHIEGHNFFVKSESTN